MRTSIRNGGLGLLAAVPLLGLLLAVAPAHAAGAAPVLPCPPGPGTTFCVTRTTPVYASLPPGAQVGRLVPGRAYHAFCQASGERVTRGGHYSHWWVRSDAGWAGEIDVAGLADDQPVPGLAYC